MTAEVVKRKKVCKPILIVNLLCATLVGTDPSFRFTMNNGVDLRLLANLQHLVPLYMVW